MKFIYLFFICFCMSLQVNSQEKLQQFFATNCSYPAEASEHNVYGLLKLNLLIDANGNLKKYEIEDGLGDGCADMIVKVLKTRTNWNDLFPTEHGNLVFQIPILFLHENQFENIINKDSIYLDEINQNESSVENTEFEFVEKMPVPPGGENGLLKFIGEHVKYPKKAIKNNTTGRVIVGFVVDTSGEITKVKVLKGLGDGCDEEAVRVISSIPKWQPGEQNHKKVRVQYKIPISFKLEGKPTKSFKNAKQIDTVKLYNKTFYAPSYVKGSYSFKNDLRKNILAKLNSVAKKESGSMHLEFTINEQAEISAIHVVKSINETYDALVTNALKEIVGFYFISPSKHPKKYYLIIPFK